MNEIAWLSPAAIHRGVWIIVRVLLGARGGGSPPADLWDAFEEALVEAVRTWGGTSVLFVDRRTGRRGPARPLGAQSGRSPSMSDWTGYYTYHGESEEHWMDLTLRVTGGEVCGRGTDDVGAFAIDGSVDGAGQCVWTKIYPASQGVSYRGILRGNTMEGRWGVLTLSGTFRIWRQPD